MRTLYKSQEVCRNIAVKYEIPARLMILSIAHSHTGYMGFSTGATTKDQRHSKPCLNNEDEKDTLYYLCGKCYIMYLIIM